MALACPGLADHYHVDGLLHKRATAQPLDLLPYQRWKRAQLQGAKALLARQARLLEQARSPPLLTGFAFQSHQFVQVGFMTQTIAHRLERDIRKAFGHGGQLERPELPCQLSMSAAHSASLLGATDRRATNPPPPTSILAAWAAHTEEPTSAQPPNSASCR